MKKTKKSRRGKKPRRKVPPVVQPAPATPPAQAVRDVVQRTAGALVKVQQRKRYETKVTRRARRLARRRAFIRYFLRGGDGFPPGNASQAVLAAGYTDKVGSAGVLGYRLMRDPEIQESIRRGLEAAQLSDDRLLEELGRIAMSNVRDVAEAIRAFEAKEVDALPDHVAAVVKSYEEAPGEFGTRRSVTLHDKTSALALLARIKKLLVNRTELTGKDGGPVEVEERVVVYVPDNGRLALPPPTVVELPRSEAREIQGVSDPADASWSARQPAVSDGGAVTEA